MLRVQVPFFSLYIYIFMILIHTELAKVGFFVLFAIALSAIIILLSYFLSDSAPDVEKVSAYECGFDPYEDARNVFDVRFYLVAILFIIFDLEAIYFFPWCVSLNFLNLDGFWGMTDFIIELFVGYYYAWQVGALNWE